MAWQVALVLDTQTPIEPLLGMMPVWALASPERRAEAQKLRSIWDPIWNQDPALTRWTVPAFEDWADKWIKELPLVEMHHCNLNCVRLFGVPISERLVEELAKLGYEPVSGDRYPGLGFALRMQNIQDEQQIILDAKGWSSPSDFYCEFFRAVGAPEWHGRNFDALIDSIETGRINQIEVPYQIVVRNTQAWNDTMRKFLDDFADLVRQMQSDGCPVSLLLQD
jgi:RNAse (barnase) inhibitor barstar